MGGRIRLAVLVAALLFIPAVLLSDTSDAAPERFTEGDFVYEVWLGDVVSIAGLRDGFDIHDYPEGRVEFPSAVEHESHNYPVRYIEGIPADSGIVTAVIPSGVLTVRDNAFRGCTTLVSAELPNTVTVIGKSAFEGCTSLSNITLPVNTLVDNYAFRGCTGLTSATVSHGTTSLGRGAFSGCTGLTSVILPDTLTTIDQECFMNCGLTSVDIPESVTFIGARAFSGCISLTSMVIQSEGFSDSCVMSDSFTFGTELDPVVCYVSCPAYPAPYTGKGTDAYTSLVFNLSDVTCTFSLYGAVQEEVTGKVGAPIMIGTTPIADYVPERDGYEFTGWDRTVPDRFPVSDFTADALWSANTYTITFYPNGETGTVQTQSIKFDTAEYLTSVSSLGFLSETRLFLRWNTADDDSGTPYADHQMVSGLKDTALYAIWQPAPYQVTFDGNGSTGTMNKQPFSDDPQPLYQNTYVRLGYIFSGWARSAGSTESVVDPPYTGPYTFPDDAKAGGKLTLYAIWTPISYTVHYDCKGHGSAPDKVAAYDETFALPVIDPYEGHTLAGWSLYASATQPTYAPGQEVKNLTTSRDSTVNLYAVWEPMTLYIVFHSGNEDAKGSMQTQSITYDETKNLNANGFTYLYHKFDGWALVQDGPRMFDNRASVTGEQMSAYKDSDNRVHLYGLWAIGSYRIVYDPGPGDGHMDFPMVQNYQTYVLDECLYTCGDRAFLGWSKVSSDGPVQYSSGEEVENLSEGADYVILYAVWAKGSNAEFVYIAAISVAAIAGIAALAGFVFLRRR